MDQDMTMLRFFQAFSPDARWLITAAMDTSIRLWDLPSARYIMVLSSAHLKLFRHTWQRVPALIGGGVVSKENFWDSESKGVLA